MFCKVLNQVSTVGGSFLDESLGNHAENRIDFAVQNSLGFASLKSGEHCALAVDLASHSLGGRMVDIRRSEVNIDPGLQSSKHYVSIQPTVDFVDHEVSG